MNRILKNFRRHEIIITIVIFGFLLRLAGITWGFPATLHNDESVVVRSALGMRFGDLNPHHFDWPSLYFYINYFVFWLFIKLRTQLQLAFGVKTMIDMFPFWWGPTLPFYLLGRLVSVAFSTALIPITYLIALETLSDKRKALWAAFFVSFSYILIYLSYYALSDSALTFFMMTSLLFSIRISKRGKLKDYILAGIFAGLATSVKYNGALMCGIIYLAHLLRNDNPRIIFDKKLFVSAVASLIVFFVGTPYAILDWKTFGSVENAKGAFWQISHMGRGLNWFYHIKESFVLNFGVILSMISYSGLVALLTKSRAQKLISLTFIILWLYIGSWNITRWHYSMPMIVPLAIGAGYVVGEVLNNSKNAVIKSLIILILLAQPLFLISKEIVKRNREDTRIAAGKWIENNIPKNTSIVMSGQKTGIYGGENPVFNWSDYNVNNNEEDVMWKNVEEEYYIVMTKSADKGKNIDFRACKVFENNFRTGPEITICKRKANQDSNNREGT